MNIMFRYHPDDYIFSSMSIGYECRRSVSESMYGLCDKIVDHYAEKWSNVFALSWFDAGRRLNSWPPMLIRSVTENMSCALATRTRNTQGACARQDDQNFFFEDDLTCMKLSAFQYFPYFPTWPNVMKEVLEVDVGNSPSYHIGTPSTRTRTDQCN